MHTNQLICKGIKFHPKTAHRYVLSGEWHMSEIWGKNVPQLIKRWYCEPRRSSCAQILQGCRKIWKSGGWAEGVVVGLICPPMGIGLAKIWALPPPPPHHHRSDGPEDSSCQKCRMHQKRICSDHPWLSNKYFSLDEFQDLVKIQNSHFFPPRLLWLEPSFLEIYISKKNKIKIS